MGVMSQPEIIKRKGPHPLQSLYNNPRWREKYYRGLVRELAKLPAKQLAKMLVQVLQNKAN